MTSLEPRTSGEALGSALAIAMALFVLCGPNVPPRALREHPDDGNACNKIRCSQRRRAVMRRAEKAAVQRRLRSGHAAGQPAIALSATLGPRDAASISRRIFTANTVLSHGTPAHRKPPPSPTPRLYP